MKRKNIFNNLPDEIKTKIYKYDTTYRDYYKLVLHELEKYFFLIKIRNITSPHSFIIILNK